ncbi:hypothetical protein J4E90_008667 [Alternaria incomplexa]|uniref:uncharacterized protein n=1 Tax=Alternaria incomplexa TaxID=1187928 RepID=UPI00221F36CA|nr:uncharacterized protein J4E90_008667 [Alternaria incomplexa]KAI4908929.1 hypothetical protein J4E90_008667 [Alternaria incomplexa]
MFDKLRGKSPSGHSKGDSTDSTKDNSSFAPPPPAYTAPSSSASQPALSHPVQTRFASLSLHKEDRLRFLRFPEPIISKCRATILSTRPLGINKEQLYANSHEFKLNGYPWGGYGKEGVEARRLMNGVLATLHASGWLLTLNTDISKSAMDKDTLLFRFQNPIPVHHEWCVVAFSRQNRLRFIDAPASLYESFPARVGADCILESGLKEQGVWECKLRGNPWQPSGEETMRVRELLIVLVELLEEEGWSVYASIDQKSSGGQGVSETDTWHCCRVKGWEKGMPVYMR